MWFITKIENAGCVFNCIRDGGKGGLILLWKIIRGEGIKKSQITAIEIEKISCDGRFQPRFEIDEASLDELVGSIKDVGVIQPILVRPQGECYELIAGERRLRASVKAGLKEIPAVVRELSDAEAAEVALVENMQRRNLHYFEEAEGFARLIAEFHLTQTDVARKMGLSQSAVANKLRLLRLHSDVRAKIIKQKLSERHARALLELPERESQLRLLDLALKKEINVIEWERMIKRKKTQNISREIIKGHKQRLKPIVKDMKIFINSLEKGVETLRAAGLDVQLQHQKIGDSLRIVIEIGESNG